METMYVINGFYTAMREKYTKPGSSIQYFVVEWDATNLSWADFRGKVLGATDPATAAPNSLRRIILDDYKALGLESEPNVGDNGIHASASPFEALAERMNWIGAELATDTFGKLLLEIGVPEDTIMQWTKDPQVEFEGKQCSLFDLLEDTNVEECLAKLHSIAGSKVALPANTNAAFVFIKPHAIKPAVKELLEKKFQEAGITIKGEGQISYNEIEAKKLIDNHYYAIANKASLTKPKDLNPPESKQEEFGKKFGLSWNEALNNNLVFNAVDACSTIGIDGAEMDKIWGEAKKAGRLVKFGGGFYCGQIEVPKKEEIKEAEAVHEKKEEKKNDKKKGGKSKSGDKDDKCLLQ